MSYETITLPHNGLRIVIEEVPSVETLSVSVLIKAGSMFESVPGLAHFFEHVVFDGTRNYPQKSDLLALIVNKGIIWNGSTSKNWVHYFTQGFARDLPAMCEFLSQITLHPRITQEALATERQVIGKEIKRLFDNLPRYTNLRAVEHLYPNQPLGQFVLGSEESLTHITPELLQSFWEKHYVAPNTVIAVRGKYKKEEVIQTLTQYFMEMRGGEDQTLPLSSPITTSSTQTEIHPGLSQSHFRLLFPSYSKGENARYAAYTLFSLMVRGLSSRIVEVLREREGLIYSLIQQYQSEPNYGYFGFGSGIDPEALPRTLSLTQTEFQKVTEELVSPEELQKAISTICTRLAIDKQNNQDATFELAYDLLLEYKITSLEEEIACYQAVTLEEIQRIARELFSRPLQTFILTSHS